MNASLKGVAIFCAMGGAVFAAASNQLLDFKAMFPNPADNQPAALLQTDESVTDEAAPVEQATEVAVLVTEEPTVEQKPAAIAEAAVEEVVPEFELTGPTFDILRVEPDGSTLIAGRATPGSEIEILSGDDVVASTTANAAGEFVALLDDALAIGDYAMAIRSTPEKGEPVVSQQTAIVSIPEDKAQGVLAMVEMPGEASRLISTPQIAQVPEQEVAEQEVAEQEVAEQEVAEQEVAEQEVAEQEVAEQEVAAVVEETPVAIAPDILMLAPSAPIIAVEEEPALETAEAPSEAVTAPEILQLGAGTPLFATADEPEVVATEQHAVEVAAIEPQQVEPVDLNVSIEAVEIDGVEVFVAGAATPGSQLRVYANEILLGDVVASDGGRYLAQVERDLPVGEYTIRVDMLNPETAEVIRRAAVPFTRTGETRLAAVAVEPAVELPSSAPVITQQVEPAVAPAEATEVPTVTATLEPTNQSVIIRRGDTLWQISRRVYGKGVKYTTIYLANQDQIQNPGRIWPGQIFDVPDQAQDEAVAFEKHQELRQQR
ncbi:MAG: LysM peptidoglycan-binding domain-containing protein [Pseudomonadota bacterium]